MNLALYSTAYLAVISLIIVNILSIIHLHKSTELGNHLCSADMLMSVCHVGCKLCTAMHLTLNLFQSLSICIKDVTGISESITGV